MEQTDELNQANISAAPKQASSTAARIRDNALIRLLWSYRVFAAGLFSFASALAGEFLMRAPRGSDAADLSHSFGIIGSLLVAIAVLLVGLVAWVNDGLLMGRNRSVAVVPAGETGDAPPIPVRAARSANALQVAPKPGLSLRSLRAIGSRYSAVRTRLGWFGTAAGLVVATALGVWLALVLRADWHDPLAGWVWLALMLLLLLTFVGLRPWPSGASLLAHDPAEPAFEPPVPRAEWIVLTIIMIAAVVLRFWHLDSIPVGPYIDESGRAIDARNINYGLPVNGEQFVFFGTGWWGVPSFYFWLVAQSMKVFGDNLLGARVVHALAGVGTVWYTYRTGRVVWSPRVGLIAGALIAISDFAIQASRTAGESTITLFFWTACFYYLYKALKMRRRADFVLAGLAGGFVLLGYASGKLLPPFLILAALYLLIRWGFTGVRRYLPGLLLMALATAAVCAPNLVYQYTQKPSAMTERYNSVTIFTPQQRSSLAAQYGSDNIAVIVARQYVAAYSAYDVGQERGPFYPTGMPVLPVPWAALWILGTAYVVWRLGDARYAVLGIWIVAALSGSALTIDVPTLQRALMIIPTLALLPAIFLDRVASNAPPLKYRAQNAARSISDTVRALGGRASIARNWVTWGVIGAFVLFSAFQVLTYYFGPYTDKALYIEYTLAGRYMEKLDPAKDVVYDFGLPVMYGDPSPLAFLGNKIKRYDFSNSSDMLPVTENDGKDVHFMVAPSDDPIMGLLKSIYPGGTQTTLDRPDGTPVVAVYHVTAGEIDRYRVMAARYRMPDGVLVEKEEPRLGTGQELNPKDTPGDFDAGPPSGIVYPTTAQWMGGLVSPAYGTYRMQLQAPAGGTLTIDGEQVLTATAGVPSDESRVVLSQGMHTLSLQGTMDSPTTNIQLLWGTDNGEMVPVGREFLWGGPQGALSGEVYAQPGTYSWILLADMPTTGSSPSQLRNDSFFSWGNINQSTHLGPNPFVVWRGTLLAPAQGTYGFSATASGALSIWIDGKLVGATNVPNGQSRWPVQTTLTEGPHQFEVRFFAMQDYSQLHLYWQMPGALSTLIPPSALLPPETGAWLPSQTQSVPSPDNSLLHSDLQKNVRVAASMNASGWREALGLAVLPDGRYAVGDSEAHKLIIYDVNGAQHATWGGASSGAGTFNDVSDLVAGPGGTIVALDAENGDIRIFDEDGKQISQISRSKMGLTHARGITLGPEGKLYIADTAGSRVVRISNDGTIEQEFRGGDDSIKPLDQPIDVAVAPNGSVYVVDLLKRVVEFDPSGKALREWQVPIGLSNGGSKLALWDGLLIVSNPEGNSIGALDTDKGTFSRLTAVNGDLLAVQAPTGLAVGPDDKLYVVDNSNKRVLALEQAQQAP